MTEAEFVAVDIETTGNRPFLVLEIGAERFRLSGSLGLFDTLVHTRAPINPYAKRRHLIEREMLIGAPQFSDARRAFLHFARGAVLVEHSHDAFDTWILGRGLPRPLEHPVVDTTALGRLVLELPAGQTPGLARLVEARVIERFQVTPPGPAGGDAGAGAGACPRRPGRRPGDGCRAARAGAAGGGEVRLANGRRPGQRAAAAAADRPLRHGGRGGD